MVSTHSVAEPTSVVRERKLPRCQENSRSSELPHSQLRIVAIRKILGDRNAATIVKLPIIVNSAGSRVKTCMTASGRIIAAVKIRGTARHVPSARALSLRKLLADPRSL